MVSSARDMVHHHHQHHPRDSTRNASLQDDDGANGGGSRGREAIEGDGAQCREDGAVDAAALAVMLYLLFISSLLVGAIVLGLLVVVRYGLVVLVAVCAAAFGMLVVAATVMSVITRDAKLNRARSKIKSWHVTCKEEILKELDNLVEDFAALTSGQLLLTYDGPLDQTEGENPDDHANIDELAGDEFDNNESRHQNATPASSANKKRGYRPKSLLFRAFAPFAKSNKSSSSSSQHNGSTGRKPMRPWKRNKTKASDGACSYDPPNLV